MMSGIVRNFTFIGIKFIVSGANISGDMNLFRACFSEAGNYGAEAGFGRMDRICLSDTSGNPGLIGENEKRWLRIFLVTV